MRTNYAIGNYKKALPYAQKLEQLSTSLDDYSLSYNFLGVIYSKLGDKKQELNYSLKNLEINKKQGNRNNIGISLNEDK
jgi:tetratricopeptide (TPR) repeat protein